MKIVQINATCDMGSTGKIVSSISDILTDSRIENYVLYSHGHHKNRCGIKYAKDPISKICTFIAKLFGCYGFENVIATRALIKKLDQINPDIIHLHNVHNHACNLEMLFSWVKAKNKKVIWTFHDCWAFTAYCPYFDLAKCNRWETGCCDCPQYHKFSWLWDRSKYLYRKKQKIFTGLNLTIVTPSQWLANLVKESFLKDYPVRVIHNGIDLSVFQPTESDFRERYHISPEKHILLGVAFDWSFRKGMDVFLDLAKRLNPEEYQIVLVGVDDKIDKSLPAEIISIHRTKNQKELAEIYTAADLFVNPTREENYPTVNMESIACGTPVLTFRTGGSPEIIGEFCGSVVDYNNIEMLEKEIRVICTEKPYSLERCVFCAEKFNQEKRFREYLKLYYEIIKE